MDNPVGGIARGWHAIRAIYERLFAGSGRLCAGGRRHQVHHHGSIEDPALLAAYRQAVSPAAR